jgi:hypothetical protein
MKPTVLIWIKQDSLNTIARGEYPQWWNQSPIGWSSNYICIQVPSDWFVAMRDYEDSQSN